MDENGSTKGNLAKRLMLQDAGLYSRSAVELLRSTLAALEEGILLRDPEGTMLMCNAGAERILGVPAEELLGRTRLCPETYFIREDGSPLAPEADPLKIAQDDDEQHSILGIYAPQRPLTWISIRFQPLFRSGETLPYAVVTSFFDITESKQSADALKQSLEKVRRAAEGAIRMMAAAVEMMDPSTTGHQRRVAGLAAAIARRMGLPERDVEAVRTAGEIHDIGKISIPAEILRTPRRLSELEFRIVKRHPQSAYDILKDADLPSPIAGIVLLHHERIDGSGYPFGLSGEDIILGAKILAVADVVETMSSPRPYRPALGLDSALEEITQHRGTLYAPEVVDACVEVVTEPGFALE